MKLKIVGALLILAMASVSHASGVQLSRTRFLIEDGATKVSYGLTNHSKSPILASATMSNLDGSATDAFAVYPSLYQVQPNKTNQGQIVLLKQLPSDKESVFWLTVKTVNAAPEKEGSNQLQIALAQSVKVFYRPKGLKENTNTGLKKLYWNLTKDGIQAVNDSKVSFSIFSVTDLNNKVHRIGDVVLPGTDKLWKIDNKGVTITSFTFVDEYGNYINQKINK